MLIAAAYAHLWSLFRQCSDFCVQTEKESPLLVHPETAVSWLLGSSRLFPGFLPVSCGALVPFRLCSHSQHRSSPWDLTSEARASAPSPHLSVGEQRSLSGWWVLVGTDPLRGNLSALPSAPLWLHSLHGSKASPQPTPHFHQWRASLVCGNFSSFTAPSQRCRSRPYSFVSVFSFFFCPTQVCGEFLAFWEVWGLLPAFSRCSVGGVPHVDVFLMYLWGGRWSPCLAPLPSWRFSWFRVLMGNLVLWLPAANESSVTDLL